MQFTLFLVDRPAPSAYFRVRSDGGTLFSPAYADREEAAAALVSWVQALRQLDPEDENCIDFHHGSTVLSLFGDREPAVPGSTAYAEPAQARSVLRDWQRAARTEAFDLTVYRSEGPAERDEAAPNDTAPERPGSPRVDPTEIDDYHPKQESGSDRPGVQRFATDTDDGKRYYFHLNNAEGKPFLLSEGYQTRAGRDNGLQSVLRNLSDRQQGEIIDAGKGLYCFRLVARNNHEIGRSRPTDDRTELEEELRWMRRQIVKWLHELELENNWHRVGSSTIEVPPSSSEEECFSEERNYDGEDPGYRSDRVLDPSSPATEQGRGYDPGAPYADPAYGVGGTEPPAAAEVAATVFHPLEPFGPEDSDRFFGREREVEDLYDMIFQKRLLLVYGPPQVGKTSLVRCGLANRVGDSRWESIYLDTATGKPDTVLEQALRPAEAALDIVPDPTVRSPLDRLERIYEWGFRPLALVFDNLEALFSTAVTREERDAFFSLIKALNTTKEFPCRVILILDESALAALVDYEELIPELLDNRYRVRPLLTAHAVPAVSGTLDRLQSAEVLTVDQPRLVAEAISRTVGDESREVSLTCLEIYLYQLYHYAAAPTEEGLPCIHPALIEAYPARPAIDAYLRKRARDLQDPGADLSPAKKKHLREYIETTRTRCGCPVEEEDTSRGGGIDWPPPPTPEPVRIVVPVPVAILPPYRPAAPEPPRIYVTPVPVSIVPPPPVSPEPPAPPLTIVTPVPVPILPAKKVAPTRVIPWLRILSLIGLIGSVIGMYFLYLWLQCFFDPCCQARQTDTCAAYLEYVAHQGREADCSAEFTAILRERGCGETGEIEMINRLLVLNTCAGYREYLDRYTDTGLASRTFRTLLTERGCYVPGIRDTIYAKPDTVIQWQTDTIYLPSELDEEEDRIDPNDPCTEVDGTPMRKLGALNVMIQDVPGGPFTWYEALEACDRLGMRLPCEGEIREEINTFFTGDSYPDRQKRAYELVTSSRRCPLVGPVEKQSAPVLNYWTATEAMDANAWAFYIDNVNKTIGTIAAIDKNRRLPCRCIQREKPGDPPCYAKVIRRPPAPN